LATANVEAKYHETIVFQVHTSEGIVDTRDSADSWIRIHVSQGESLSIPCRKAGGLSPKLSDCSPLFLHAYQQRNAG
jgi:hypothetical protein